MSASPPPNPSDRPDPEPDSDRDPDLDHEGRAWLGGVGPLFVVLVMVVVALLSVPLGLR